MKTSARLTDLTNAAAEYIMKHADEGGSSEFDQSINDISRETIDACCAVWGGACYVGKINLYDGKRNQPVLRRITSGDEVQIFSADFAIMTEDAELVQMIVERSQQPHADARTDMIRIISIVERLEELDAAILLWA